MHYIYDRHNYRIKKKSANQEDPASFSDTKPLWNLLCRKMTPQGKKKMFPLINLGNETNIKASSASEKYTDMQK